MLLLLGWQVPLYFCVLVKNVSVIYLVIHCPEDGQNLTDILRTQDILKRFICISWFHHHIE